MKKIFFSLLLTIPLIAGLAHAFDISGCEERSFTVTAYYSPESGQIFYYKPSFQDEVILNGEGYVGASGKKVFNGMLAGPATYPFGSIIYFPGLGAGEIADRGGAIVLSGERGQSADRIDIWMGRGEEGLIRALTFGKKSMTGYFCNTSSSKNSGKNTLLREQVPVLKYFFDIGIWIQELKGGRNDIRVWTLQKYLNKLGYLDFKYWHGAYDAYTKKALCKYQVAKKILGAKHPDCGTFGKLTRSVMKIDVQKKGLLPKDLYAKGTFAGLLELAQWYNGKPETDKLINGGNDKKTSVSSGTVSVKSSSIFRFYRAYTKGQQSSEIKILQTFLQEQGLYSGNIDGIYSKATTNAVYAFQKNYGLISDTDALALRGYLGPTTRSKINELRIK